MLNGFARVGHEDELVLETKEFGLNFLHIIIVISNYVQEQSHQNSLRHRDLREKDDVLLSVIIPRPNFSTGQGRVKMRSTNMYYHI